MRAQHTPGPWEVGHQNDGTPVVTFEARDIATVENYYRDGNANARLIAAAPDLLAALEALDPYLDTIPGGIGEYIDNARAAIAKARGEA